MQSAVVFCSPQTAGGSNQFVRHSNILTDEISYDTTERVEQDENGACLHIRSKRWTGTRDEDKVSGELHADSVGALDAECDQLRETVTNTLREFRHTQPDRDLLTEDEQRELANEFISALDDVGEDQRAVRDTIDDVVTKLGG